MKDPYKNKQVILDRIRRFAAGHYGLSQVDLLDPVSSLFLESLGEEIYRLSGEIEQMENRILNKLSSMLVSEVDQTAIPSHSILHARAISLPLEITDKMLFSCKSNRLSTSYDLSFYPVCNTQIYPGDIKYMVYRGQFYSTEIYGTKTLLTRSKKKDNFSDHIFWLGIDFEDSVKQIENLSFYIDLAGIYNKESYLKELSHIVLKVGEQELFIQKGLYSIANTEENKTLDFYSAFDNSNILNKKIKALYDSHYLSISSSLSVKAEKEILPEFLRNQFDTNLVENISKPLLWLQFVCPKELPIDVIESLQISINTFPVVCKKLVSRIEEVNKIIPVIPLRTESNESFLSVSNLINSAGKKYYDIPIHDTDGKDCPLYSLRRGGYERFNERDAEEYLSNTIQTLDSESSSFFRNGKEMKTEMKQIRIEMAHVLRNLKNTVLEKKDKLEVENYLQVSQEQDREVYFIEYWVINYQIANGIRSGVSFRPESDIPVSLANLISLLPVTSGKASPMPEEKAARHKMAINSSSLIITKDDIIRFCKDEFTGTLKQIEVKIGYEESVDKKQGFLRTTDIYIQTAIDKNPPLYNKKGDLLKEQLQKHSPATYRYRVFLI